MLTPRMPTRASHTLRIWVSGLLALVLAVLAQACTSDLSDSLEGKGCNASNECLSGYVCNDAGRCVRPDSGTLGGSGNVSQAGSGNVNVVCREGETVCGGAIDVVP